MSSIYAIQVRTGFEIKVKEMLEFVLQKANETRILNIYALHTKTKIISQNSENAHTDTDSESNIEKHFLKKQYALSIKNKREQLKVIERYRNPEYEEIKKQYKKEINELQRKLALLKKEDDTQIRTVLKGYILIELKDTITYLPNQLWQLIKSVPHISRILSRHPIPEDEVANFWTNLDDELSPEVEIYFDEVMEEKEIEKEETKLLKQINDKKTNRHIQKELLRKINELRKSFADKVRGILQAKPNPFTTKIKTFNKRKREVVAMPLKCLKLLYTENEIKTIRQGIDSYDFLNRLKKLVLAGEQSWA